MYTANGTIAKASARPKVSTAIVLPNARHRPRSPRVRRLVSQM